MTDGQLDAFGHPVAPMEVEPSPGETQDRESAFSGDWPDGYTPPFDGDAPAFEPAEVFNTLPPDIHLSHEGEAIVTSLAGHMGPKGMSDSQIHEALKWASDFAGTEADDTSIFENFAMAMSKNGMSRSQVDQVKAWADSYEGSEDQKDDAAEAAVDEAIERIQSKMGTAEYIRSEKMQADYRMLVGIRDGDGEE